VMRNAIAAVGAVLVLVGATASSAFAYPSRVETTYKVKTTGGTCDVTVVASTEPGLAAVDGQLRGIESVYCGALTFTPYYINLSGGFSNTSLDPLNVLYSDEPDHRCERQKTCYWSRSKAWFPPGDHSVTHAVDIDVASYAVGDTFLSYPSGCRVASNDRGHLICAFTQWVTMPAPASV
jgi:hypothetical protein